MTIKIKHLPLNTIGRDFVVGDLHGAFSCLEQALIGVEFDRDCDRLISVGDLVDRGPENELCLSLLDEPWFHSVHGNHESMMYDGFNDGPYGYAWLSNGGQWGLQHLHGDDQAAMDVRRQVATLPEQPMLITVDLPDGKKFHVIHAELRAMHQLTDDILADPYKLEEYATVHTADGYAIMWGRFIFGPIGQIELNEHAVNKFVRTVGYNHCELMFGPGLSHIYSGHTIVKNPVRFYGQTNIDTGAHKSYEKNSTWGFLTITEPLTDRFWKATASTFEEISPTIIPTKNANTSPT